MTAEFMGRRPVLKGLSALGTGAIIPVSTLAANKTTLKLDPRRPADQSLIFRKLAFSSDEKIGFWWLRGTRYGLVDSEFTPFWEMHHGSFFRVRDLSDGEYEVTTMEASFYTDLVSGEFIRKFINPYTGKSVDIRYFPPKRSTVRYNMAGRVGSETGVTAGLESTGAIGPAWIEGDQVWVRGDHLLRGAAAGRPIRVNDLWTFFGSLRDVADPSIRMAAAGQIFSDMNSWPAWLDMGDRPGSYCCRTYGRKAFSYEAMPALWRKLMEQEHPEIAKDPARALQG
jgi:hypothetical protein